MGLTSACAQQVDETEIAQEKEQSIWRESGPFFDTWENVDDRTSGIYGSVVRVKEDGCSGTLVARDVVLTAAHCGTCGDPIEVLAGPDLGTSTPAYSEEGIFHCSPSAGSENDQWLGGVSNVGGANDLAIVKLPSPVPEGVASLAELYMGPRASNGLPLHEDGGNGDSSSVVTLVGYGRTCKFTNNCGEHNTRYKVNAWAYNWFDPCNEFPGEFAACSDRPVIAVSAKKSFSGSAAGDSGGPMFFEGKQIGVTSLDQFQPFGFEGNVYAPVSSTLAGARWLRDWIQPEPDFDVEDIGIYGLEATNIHDRAEVAGGAAGPDFEIGSGAIVQGDIYADDIFIRQGNWTETLQFYSWEFQGILQADGDVENSLPSYPSQELEPCFDLLDEHAFTAPDIWTNYDPPNSGTQTISLPPGQYGRIRVKRDVILEITDGIYSFRALDLGQGSVLHHSGTDKTWVYVESTLDIKGKSSSTFNGVSNDLFIGVVGSQDVHLHGADQNNPAPDFQATILAPNAKVEVHSFYQYEGQIIAREVELHQDAVFTARASGPGYCHPSL